MAKDQKDLIAEALLEAWDAGKVCLHPSDTLPGLSFNPTSEKARNFLYDLKQRPWQKSCIYLAKDLSMVERFANHISPNWLQILDKLWPGPLTVVLSAKDANLVPMGQDGSIAVRVPYFDEDRSWMRMVLERVETIFPSTSVNISGEKSMTSWKEAINFAEKYEQLYIPSIKKIPNFAANPSTIIRLGKDKDFELLRQGVLTSEQIVSAGAILKTEVISET